MIIKIRERIGKIRERMARERGIKGIRENEREKGNRERDIEGKRDRKEGN